MYNQVLLRYNYYLGLPRAGRASWLLL